MERTPPIPVELWEQIPPHVQAVLWEVFDRYEARIAKLGSRSGGVESATQPEFAEFLASRRRVMDLT